MLWSQRRFLNCSLNLNENNGPIVHLDKEIYAKGKERMGLCLIGKELGNKVANHEGLEGAMRAVWKISHNFKVEQTGSNNVFAFHFGKIEELHRALSGRGF